MYFQCFELPGNHIQVDFRFRFKRVDIARNVQVVVVGLDGFQAGDMAEFILIDARQIRFDDFMDMRRAQDVLRFNFIECLAGVNEQDIVRIAAAFLEHQHAGGNAGTVEDIGRQADHGIQAIHLLDQILADMAFRRAPK